MGSSGLKGLRKALATHFPTTETVDKEAKLKRLWFEACKGIPFWYWDRDEHVDADIAAQDRAKELNNPYLQCCYQHLIGLPLSRDGIENPLFPWQKNIIDTISNNMYTAIVKASGLGVSELLLRYIAWLCLKDNKFRDSQVMILTGPREDLAVSLIARMKHFMSRNSPLVFTSKETVIELNGCRIESFPSKNLSSSRGLSNPKFILLDEADHFKGYADEAKEVSERYIGKSDPTIVMCSTPSHINSLLHREFQNPKSIYKKLILPYTIGLGTIYDIETIRQASLSPSFQKEYNCNFASAYGTGSVFTMKQIEEVQRIGDLCGDSTAAKHDANIIHRSFKSCGVDVAHGGGARTALTICGMYEYFDQRTQQNADTIQVLFSKAWDYHTPHEQIVNEMMQIFSDYNVLQQSSSHVYVDAAAQAMVQSLKYYFQDQERYWLQLEFARRNHSKLENLMRVIPVQFGSSANFGEHSHRTGPQHKQLLANLIYFVENKYLGVHRSHVELLQDLSSAVADDLSLDKSTNSMDLLDSLRLALAGYRVKR
jgi:hypothetical protein